MKTDNVVPKFDIAKPKVVGIPKIVLPKVSLGNTNNDSKPIIKEDTSYLEYIQDNLVFQLDGINKGPNKGCWTDLVGGIVFKNYGVKELKNGYDFTNNSLENIIKLESDTELNYKYDECLIEVVFEDKLNYNSTILSTSINKGISFSISFFKSNNEMCYVINTNESSEEKTYKFYNTNYVDNLNTVGAINEIKPIINTIQIRTSTFTRKFNKINDYNKTIIGNSNNNNNFFNGKLYAIRIYKKQNVNIIYNNQQIDVKRFNIKV